MIKRQNTFPCTYKVFVAAGQNKLSREQDVANCPDGKEINKTASLFAPQALVQM